MKRARIALLAGLVLASAPVALRAFEDKAPADDKKAPEKLMAPMDKGTPAPVVAPPAPGCGGTMTVWVNEYVPETYQTTRTTYKTEFRNEVYTTYKTEYVQETKTRNVTKYVKQQVEEERTICKYISVPSVETRCVTKRVAVCEPCTVHHRKLVRLGHWECREVQPLFGGLHSCGCNTGCGGCGDSCGGCASACTRTRKVWVHCPEYEDCCETKMVKKWKCVTETCQVNVCKKVAVQEKVKVCVTKCVPVCTPETYTCCVKKCVPCQATRCVKVCVPCTENVTCTRMVCKKVAKQVPCAPCAAPCSTSCGCESKCHRSFDFGRFFHRDCGCGAGCSTCGGCN